MQPVLQLISRVGPSDANVLITGEPGTGKEVVARTLYAVSGRAARPMVTVNAGGLAEGVFESELFGHVKGAFTDAKMDRVGRFELADGGTLFLDEIANVPMNLQAKLLRVLEIGEMERVGSSKTKRVDVRVISATNASLGEEVAAGRFRQDLLFRLNTIEIHLPPLRERREDIPVLAAHFLGTHARRYRKTLQGFDPPAMQALLENPWQGNVRELNHVVERAVLMAQDNLVRAGDLALRAGLGRRPARLEDMSLEEVEAFLIKKALARYNGNVSHAANALGLEPQRAVPAPAALRLVDRHGAPAIARRASPWQPTFWHCYKLRPVHEQRMLLLALGAGLPARAGGADPAVDRRIHSPRSSGRCGGDRRGLVGLRRSGARARGLAAAHARRICSKPCAKATIPFAPAARAAKTRWAK